MPTNYEPPYQSMKHYTPNFQGIVDAISELEVSVNGSETLTGRESVNQKLDTLNATTGNINSQMNAIKISVDANTVNVATMTTAVNSVKTDVDNIAKSTLAHPSDYLTTRLGDGSSYYSSSNALPVSIPGGISIGDVNIKNVPLPVSLTGGTVTTITQPVSLSGGTITVDTVTHPVSLSGGTVVVSSVTNPVSLSGGTIDIHAIAQPVSLSGGTVSVSSITNPVSLSGGTISVNPVSLSGGTVVVSSVTNPIRLDTTTPPNVNVVNIPDIIVDTIKGGVITTVQSVSSIDTLKGGIVTRIDTIAGGRITQLDTLLGFVDITPATPLANDYLPVRLTDSSGWIGGSDTLPFIEKTSTNSIVTITISAGNTTSSAFSISGQNSLIHVPPANPSRTVKLQILAGDSTSWIDAITQVTNTSTYSFIKSGDIANAISGATGAGKNNFRMALDASSGGDLSFKIESRG